MKFLRDKLISSTLRNRLYVRLCIRLCVRFFIENPWFKLAPLCSSGQAVDKNQQAAFLCSFHTPLSGFPRSNGDCRKTSKSLLFSKNERCLLATHTLVPSQHLIERLSNCASNWEVKKWKFRKKPNTWPTYGSSSCKSWTWLALSAHRDFSVCVCVLVAGESIDWIWNSRSSSGESFLCGKKLWAICRTEKEFSFLWYSQDRPTKGGLQADVRLDSAFGYRTVLHVW